MVTYEELLQTQLIKKISAVEKEKYVSFHALNYKLDVSSAFRFLEIGNPKYAVIAGYYAVLNVTLWYFAKYFDLKISREESGVHTNCLIVLERFVKEERLKQRILALLDNAQREFVSFTVLKTKKEETLPLMLRLSAGKRKRYTYYSTERELPIPSNQLQEAKEFLENIVKPYFQIMENLRC